MEHEDIGREAGISLVKAALEEQGMGIPLALIMMKGDLPGHEFHGNQHTGGGSAGAGLQGGGRIAAQGAARISFGQALQTAKEQGWANKGAAWNKARAAFLRSDAARTTSPYDKKQRLLEAEKHDRIAHDLAG